MNNLLKEFIQTEATKIRKQIIAKTCLYCGSIHGILGKCITLVVTKDESVA